MIRYPFSIGKYDILSKAPLRLKIIQIANSYQYFNTAFDTFRDKNDIAMMHGIYAYG
jgi:hypothetical protein